MRSWVLAAFAVTRRGPCFEFGLLVFHTALTSTFLLFLGSSGGWMTGSVPFIAYPTSETNMYVGNGRAVELSQAYNEPPFSMIGREKLFVDSVIEIARHVFR